MPDSPPSATAAGPRARASSLLSAPRVFVPAAALLVVFVTLGAVMPGRLGKLIVPEGFLYIGHSENLGSGGEGFRLVGKTIYQSKFTQKTRDAA